MINFDCQYKESRANPGEKIGAFAEVTERDAGQYLVACIAVSAGPPALADASINTCLHRFEEIIKDDVLYSRDFIRIFKGQVTAMVEQLNKTIFNAAQRLRVHPLMSLTAVAIDPAGQTSFCQIGNTFAVLCNQENTFMATQPMTSESDFLRGGLQVFPIDRTTITALGINHTIFPKFTKTVVDQHSSIFLLSSGFSISLRETIDVINATQSKTALPDILMQSIAERRGLACSDAVLSIHPSESQ